MSGSVPLVRAQKSADRGKTHEKTASLTPLNKQIKSQNSIKKERFLKKRGIFRQFGIECGEKTPKIPPFERGLSGGKKSWESMASFPFYNKLKENNEKRSCQNTTKKSSFYIMA